MNVIKMEDITKLPIFSQGIYDGKKWLDFRKIIQVPRSIDDKIEETCDTFLNELEIESALRKMDELYGVKYPDDKLILDDSEYKRRLRIFDELLEEDLAAFGFFRIKDIIVHGSYSLDEWCCNNWGTRWNSFHTIIRNENEISFETMNYPPEPIIKKISEMYPDKIIEHYWADEPCQCCGYTRHGYGSMIEGHYVNNRSDDAFSYYELCWGHPFNGIDHENNTRR